MKVVWNESKNVSNRKAHRVSFEEASALFTSGDDYLEIFDDAHSDDEDRFIAIAPLHADWSLSFTPSGMRTRSESSVRGGLQSAKWVCIALKWKAENHDKDS